LHEISKITAKAIKNDPAFDIDGLADGFSVYFPVLIHNGHSKTIWIGAVLVNPPVDYTDGGEQNLWSAGVNAGDNLIAEKTNVTRKVPLDGTIETVTLRLKYYEGSYGGTLIGSDDINFSIEWRSIAAGIIDDTDDFEIDYEGWSQYDLSGYATQERVSDKSIKGAYSMQMSGLDVTEVGQFSKTVTMGSGSKAYLFGYIWLQNVDVATWSSDAIRKGVYLIEIESPVETLLIPWKATGTAVWRRFGVRLNPGVSNTVKITCKGIAVAQVPEDYKFALDYLQWVRYA